MKGTCSLEAAVRLTGAPLKARRVDRRGTPARTKVKIGSSMQNDGVCARPELDHRASPSHAETGGRREGRRSDEAEPGRCARCLRPRSDPRRWSRCRAGRCPWARRPAWKAAEQDRQCDEDQRQEAAGPHQAPRIAAIFVVRRRVAIVIGRDGRPTLVLGADDPRAEQAWPVWHRDAGEREEYGLEQKQIGERKGERWPPPRSLRCSHAVHGA